MNVPTIFKKRWRLPGERLMENVLLKSSLTEKTVLFLFVVIFSFSTISLLAEANNTLMVDIPIKGGSISEGVLGSPRTINPLLAFDSSDADKDLSILIYSGLLKATPNGGFTEDLSKSYTISEDALTYTFILRNDIYFHDGEPVTAEDIEFTVLKAQDPLIKSSRRSNWEGITVEVVSNKEIKFILSQPYSSFLENATLGILPKHLWKDLGDEGFGVSQLNLEPVGSGPYKIKDIKRDAKGMPLYYHLKSFKKYALGEPLIKEIFIKFFLKEDELISAFKKKKIDNINSISPKDALLLENDGGEIRNAPLSRIFGLFLNQNQAGIFTHKEVREALDLALDRDRMVEEVLAGYGKHIHGPLPYARSKLGRQIESNKKEAEERLAEAKGILENNGWKFDEEKDIWKKETKEEDLLLSFSISTADTEELKTAAEIMKEDWEKLGAKVDVKIFDISDLKQNIIRPRRYDALLFGTVIGRDLNLFPFWHSSQRNDLGLNISLYANIQVDKILEDLRGLNDEEQRVEKYEEFEKTIIEDIPAIFAYSPDFIYLTNPKIKNIKLDFITMPSERFLNVNEWYIETNNVWKIFAN